MNDIGLRSQARSYSVRLCVSSIHFYADVSFYVQCFHLSLVQRRVTLLQALKLYVPHGACQQCSSQRSVRDFPARPDSHRKSRSDQKIQLQAVYVALHVLRPGTLISTVSDNSTTAELEKYFRLKMHLKKMKLPNLASRLTICNTGSFLHLEERSTLFLRLRV